jgi:hypothetical protein
MTASSSRGTFSPAEPTEDRVITRYITRRAAVPPTGWPARRPGTGPAGPAIRRVRLAFPAGQPAGRCLAEILSPLSTLFADVT